MLKTPAVVFTIGRSTRSIDTFIEMLQAHGVERLVDVRTIPRSRHNPQFNRDGLQETLLQADKATCTSRNWAGCATPGKRLPQHGMAQRFIPRLRQLHANAGI